VFSLGFPKSVASLWGRKVAKGRSRFAVLERRFENGEKTKSNRFTMALRCVSEVRIKAQDEVLRVKLQRGQGERR